MKIYLLLFIFLVSQVSIYSQDNEEDFKFDPKTSSVIPKFLGKIIRIRGTAFAKTDNDKIPLTKDMKIYQGQTLVTEDKSIIKLEMVDKTTLTLGPNSEVNMEKFKYMTQSNRESVINFLRGQVRVHYNVKPEKEKQLRFKTNHVSMGIRGTKILASTLKNDKGHKVKVALLQGKVTLLDSKHKIEQAMLPQTVYESSDYEVIAQEPFKKLDNKDNEYLLGKLTPKDQHFLPFLPLPEGVITNDVIEDANSENSNEKSQNYQQKSKPVKNWKDTLKKLNNNLKKQTD